MDRLWTPWRFAYLTQPGPKSECIFCAKSAAPDDEANLIVYRGRECFVLLNLFPYNNGHVMIAPYAHVATLADASREALIEMTLLLRETEKHLHAIYNSPGFNLGMNIGESAGAGVAGHIHMHMLPRWQGDANFMTTIGETRILPEDLHTTWAKLRRAFQSGAR